MANAHQWGSILFNGGSSQCQSMLINANQCWSMPINANQCQSMLINANKCWSIGIRKPLIFHWSVLISIEKIWSMLIGIIGIQWHLLRSILDQCKRFHCTLIHTDRQCTLINHVRLSLMPLTVIAFEIRGWNVGGVSLLEHFYCYDDFYLLVE